MKPARFTAEARRELLDAVAWYEAHRTDLGREFSAVVADALLRIAASPATWPQVGSKGLRRFVLRRFPYTLVYGIESDQVIVVAVAHMRRKPGFWRKRATKVRRPRKLPRG